MKNRLLSYFPAAVTEKISGFLAVVLTFGAVFVLYKIILAVVGQINDQLALQNFVAGQP